MSTLYQNAVAFVYPSKYEGFGLPILEAFVNSCPVILNNASCFPEVGGDAAIYFDMEQVGEMADRVEEIISGGNDIRTYLCQKGLHQASHFSWEDSAKRMKKIYENLS